MADQLKVVTRSHTGSDGSIACPHSRRIAPDRGLLQHSMKETSDT
jgi:hypothetical protein